MSKKCGIIGGGPIGLYLALRLARKGHFVHLFEKKSWPLDKVCGQGIMPSGVKLLEDVGVSFEEQKECSSFLGIEYIDETNRIQGEISKKALGVKRTVLSHKLFQLAKAHPMITLHSNTQVEKIQDKGQEVEIELEERSFSFDTVFACDGLNSPTRKKLHNQKERRSPRRMGARVHYQITPWTDHVQVYWSSHCEAYVTPSASDLIEVAYLWREDKIEKGAFLEQRLLEVFPQLKNILNEAQSLGDFRAYGPFKEVSQKMKKGRVFFVGDAYQFLDGITGEGISLGLKSAYHLAESFETFSWKNLLKIKSFYWQYAFWTYLALAMSSSPLIRKLSFKVLRLNFVFNRILRMNDPEVYLGAREKAPL